MIMVYLCFDFYSFMFITFCCSSGQMMWAADFDEAMAWALESNCLEALVLRLPKALCRESHVECDEGTPRSKSNKLEENHVSRHDDARSLSRSPFCGLGAGNFWPKQGRQQILSMSSLLKKDPNDELSVFCVGAILVLNRSKFIKEINSMDDAIKVSSLTILILCLYNFSFIFSNLIYFSPKGFGIMVKMCIY